jgi:hypothetical protein
LEISNFFTSHRLDRDFAAVKLAALQSKTFGEASNAAAEMAQQNAEPSEEYE